MFIPDSRKCRKHLVSLNGTDVNNSPEVHFETKKILENSKNVPTPCLRYLTELPFHSHFIYDGFTSLFNVAATSANMCSKQPHPSII